jgi:hypothetical protein
MSPIIRARYPVVLRASNQCAVTVSEPHYHDGAAPLALASEIAIVGVLARPDLLRPPAKRNHVVERTEASPIDMISERRSR